VDEAFPSIYVVTTASGLPEKVFPQNCRPEHWSSDGTKLLTVRFGNTSSWIGLLDTRSGENKPNLLRHSKYQTTSPCFSWDNRWITFRIFTGETTRQIFVAPFRDGVAPDEKEWIAVTDGSTLDLEPRWSPDGSLIYFLSDRDQFRCIWAQRLDRVTKRPVSTAFEVYPFHRARLSARNPNSGLTGLAVIQDKIVLSLEEVTGNIWMTKLE
jgi:WD40 repeat protein